MSTAITQMCTTCKLVNYWLNTPFEDVYQQSCCGRNELIRCWMETVRSRVEHGSATQESQSGRACLGQQTEHTSERISICGMSMLHSDGPCGASSKLDPQWCLSGAKKPNPSSRADTGAWDKNIAHDSRLCAIGPWLLPQL